MQISSIDHVSPRAKLLPIVALANARRAREETDLASPREGLARLGPRTQSPKQKTKNVGPKGVCGACWMISTASV